MTEQVFVYIKCKEQSWIPATLVEQTKTHATVSIPRFPSQLMYVPHAADCVQLPVKLPVHMQRQVQVQVTLQDYPQKSLPLQNVNDDGTFIPCSDMVDLMFLHEVSLVQCTSLQCSTVHFSVVQFTSV
jgi:hypothetical protein